MRAQQNSTLLQPNNASQLRPDGLGLDDHSLLRKFNALDPSERGIGHQFDIRIPNRDANRLDSVTNQSINESMKVAGSIKDHSYRNLHPQHS